MNFVKILLLIVFMMFASTMAKAETTLLWDANSESDLAGYKVHRSSTSGEGYEVEATLGKITEYKIIDEPTSCVYWVVTAYDYESLESGYSNEVSNCDGLPPNNPGMLQINITDSIVTINVVNP